MVKLGGKDTYDFVRRCFQETFSDLLAKSFTFDGTKEKRSFKDLKIGMVILGKILFILTFINYHKNSYKLN